MLVYVDDTIVTGSNSLQVTQLISQLGKELSINDIGELHHLLGIEVLHTKEEPFLTQPRYALDIVSRASVDDCKPVSMPLSTSHNTKNSEHTLLPPSAITSYRSILRALQYLNYYYT